MNNELIMQLSGIIEALSHVSVEGKQNLGNLYGSIDALEAIRAKLIEEANAAANTEKEDTGSSKKGGR